MVSSSTVPYSPHNMLFKICNLNSYRIFNICVFTGTVFSNYQGQDQIDWKFLFGKQSDVKYFPFKLYFYFQRERRDEVPDLILPDPKLDHEVPNSSHVAAALCEDGDGAVVPADAASGADTASDDPATVTFGCYWCRLRFTTWKMYKHVR